MDGFDVVKHPDEVRRSIGLAGQYATVDENLTGFENLRMIGSLNHLEKSFVVSRSTELLEEFGLTDAANRNAKTYSGGMRRRLDLAAALVANPPDPLPRRTHDRTRPPESPGPLDHHRGLVEGGTTVLLTTQYLEEADRLCKQLVVLDHGTIIAEGTSQELKTRLGATVLSLTFTSTARRRARHRMLIRTSRPSPPTSKARSWNSPSTTDRRRRRRRCVASTRPDIDSTGLTPSRTESRRRVLEPHRSQGRGRPVAAAAATSGVARRKADHERRRPTPRPRRLRRAPALGRSATC